MNCVVTAGPTFEPLDDVRRLTNFSTGRLGTELANHLAAQGHEVTLLIGEQATHHGERRAQTVKPFTTAEDLAGQLKALAGKVDAIFHAAAVSDFRFGKIEVRSADGSIKEVKSGKISTREGILRAELVPTQKILSQLRDWHPKSLLVGWKFEVEGDRKVAILSGERQIAGCRTDACVVNGRAYGDGFGLVTDAGSCSHQPDMAALFEALGKLAVR